MSPKSWKSSFSDFHLSYSPRMSLKSPERRSSGRVRGSVRCPTSETPSSGFRDEETQSFRSDADRSILEGQQQPGGSGGHQGPTGDVATEELKAGEEEEDKSVKEEEAGAQSDPASAPGPEEKGHGDTPPLSVSSSELNHSFDSESLDLQLSAVANGTLYIEEPEESSPQPNGPVAQPPASQKVSGPGRDRVQSDTY